MTARSADATIKGYYYQFNKTIESLFDLPQEDNSIIIEGIEDVDVNTITGTEYVQCKYYSASALTNSTLREPIILMLDYYIKVQATRNDLKFTLFGYFKNESGEREITYNLNQLKDILTFKEDKVEIKYYESKAITDITLNAFLKIFKVAVSKEFDSYQKTLINKIKVHFNCSEFEAENYFFNNALRVILDKAKEKIAADRTITKKIFLNAINCSKVLFFSWFKKYRDHNEYLRQIKKQIKDTNIFSPSKDKLLILGKQLDISNKALPLDVFIEDSSALFYKISKSSYTAKPLTIVVDTNQDKLIETKKKLIENKVKFNDGYESYTFCHQTFCEEPIINRKPTGIITKASFQLRLISFETFKANYDNLTKKFHILYVSEDVFDVPNKIYNQVVEIKYITELTDVAKLIKN